MSSLKKHPEKSLVSISPARAKIGCFDGLLQVLNKTTAYPTGRLYNIVVRAAEDDECLAACFLDRSISGIVVEGIRQKAVIDIGSLEVDVPLLLDRKVVDADALKTSSKNDQPLCC